MRIQFEFESKTFKTHKHPEDGADMIVCWRHNWKGCPPWIEVIELKTLVHELGPIIREVSGNAKRLTAYQEFCRKMRLQGLPFSEIAKLWSEKVKAVGKATKKRIPKPLTEFQEFARKLRLESKTFQEIGREWRKLKGV